MPNEVNEIFPTTLGGIIAAKTGSAYVAMANVATGLGQPQLRLAVDSLFSYRIHMCILELLGPR